MIVASIVIGLIASWYARRRARRSAQATEKQGYVPRPSGRDNVAPQRV